MNDQIQAVLDAGAKASAARAKADASVKEVISATKRRDRLVREAETAEAELTKLKNGLGTANTPARQK